MAETQAAQKLIYLSLRDIFIGESVHLRKTKKIRKTIEENQKKPQVQYLIDKGYDLDRITKVAQALLEDGIFDSATKAKVRFPDTTKAPVVSAPATSAPATSAPPAPAPPASASVPSAPVSKISEVKVTTNGVAPTESVRSKSVDKNETSEAGKQSWDTKTFANFSKDIANIQKTVTKPQPDILPDAPHPPILPDSTCLPFWYQHRIMVRVQTTLEKACFNFALEKLGDILQENTWDCAEAVELNKWSKTLLEYQHKLDQKNPKDVQKLLPDLLTSINQIRHAAVHRLRLPARSTLNLITDAEALAKLLQDDDGLEMISTIRQQISVTIKDLEENKRLLDSRLTGIKKEFAEKRIQLAREEAALLESAKEESRKRDFFSNANPDDTLDALIAAQVRWKQRSSIWKSVDETYGPVKTHEPNLGSEMVHDSVVPVEKTAEPSGSFVPIADFQPDLYEESGDLIEGPNAYAYGNLDMATTICETNIENAENPKAVAIFDQLDSCLQAYTANSLPKLNTSLPSPSPSECEYWATPWDSRSTTEEEPAMNNFEDSEVTCV